MEEEGLLTSPKMNIISLKVSETSLATSLGFTPRRFNPSLSHTFTPLTNSIVKMRADDKGCTISGTYMKTAASNAHGRIEMQKRIIICRHIGIA